LLEGKNPCAVTSSWLPAGALAIASSAFAAEPLPPPVPIFTWSGIYIGAQLGGAWGYDNVTWSGISNDGDLAGGSFSHSLAGVIGGAHVGFNLQVNPWLVLGAEGTVDGTSLSNTIAVPVNDFMGDTPGVITATNQAEVQGSIRGRIGLAFDRALIYGTGGVAFTGFKTVLVDTTGFFTSLPGTNSTISNTRVGWTAGGGVEYAITNNWSVRVEYRYLDFGRITESPFAGQLPFANSFVSLRHRLTENQVQAGFSYRFDWTAPPPAGPLAAKY
jgi:outer membrane immunogenic protein